MSLARLIEFQLDQVPLLGMIRNEFKYRARTLCVDDFTVTLGDQQKTLVLDHVEVPGGAGLQLSESTIDFKIDAENTLAVHPVEIIVPFQVFLKTKECADDPACAADEYEIAGLQYNAILTVIASKASICMSVADVKPGIGPPLPENVIKLIKKSIGTVCAPFDLKPLRKLLKAKVTVKTSGLSADADLTRIALRLEFNEFASPPSESVADWQAFFSGQLGPHTAGKDWTLFIGKEVFISSVITRFAESLEKHKDRFELDDDTPLTAKWTPVGKYGGGHIEVNFSGQLHDTPCPNDIGIHPVTVNIDLHVDSSDPGSVQSEGVITWDAVDSDVELCAFAFGIGFSVISPWITVAVMILGAVIAGSEDPDKKDFSLPPECTAVTDTTLHCSQPVSLPPFHFGLQGALLSLQSLVGPENGPLLSGSVDWHPYTPGPLLSLQSSPIELGILGGDSCSSLHIGYSGRVDLYGYPGAVCDVSRVTDDELHVFSFETRDSVLPTTVDVRFAEGFDALAPDFLADYWSKPYPLTLRIRTGAGAQAIAFDPPAQGDPASLVDDLTFQHILCKTNSILEQTGFLGIPGKFDPHWHVDPPWEVTFQIVDSDGGKQLIPATVTWSNIQIGAAAQARGEIAQTGELTFANAQLRLKGNARVESDRFGSFDVLLNEVFAAALVGQAMSQRGDASLNLANMVKLEIAIPQNEVPRQARAMSIAIRMHPGSLPVTGQLEQLQLEGAGQSRSRVLSVPVAPMVGGHVVGEGR
jgi:hypothetical protein